MTNNIYEIFKSIDTSAWGSQTIEQFAPWELRDILSAQLGPTYTINIDEQALVDTILKNIYNKTEFSWNSTDLTILGEAEIQKILRKKGYEIQVNGMDIFPNSCSKLSEYINIYSVTTQISEITKHLKTVGTKIGRDIYKLVDIHSPKVQAIILLAGMYVYYEPTLLISALITGYVLTNCMAMNLHEYWVHDLLTPKNRVIGFIFDYITTVLWTTTRPGWRFAHSFHHLHWKTPRDMDAGAYATPWWQYLLFGVAEKNKHLIPTDQTDSTLSTQDENYNNLLPESQFLVRYADYIRPLTHLLFLLVAGPAIYIYFLLLQHWLQTRYIVYFNEIVTHHNKKTREQEADTPYIFPICCGTAYHKTHHMHADVLVVGPGWVKYFNVQYYFVKLFYNITGKMPNNY